MDKKIKVTIKPNGDAVFEASGYSGSSCQQATMALESALGSVTNRTLKPEHYLAETEGEAVREG